MPFSVLQLEATRSKALLIAKACLLGILIFPVREHMLNVVGHLVRNIQLNCSFLHF